MKNVRNTTNLQGKWCRPSKSLNFTCVARCCTPLQPSTTERRAQPCRDKSEGRSERLKAEAPPAVDRGRKFVRRNLCTNQDQEWVTRKMSLNSFWGIFHHMKCKTSAGACSKVRRGERKSGSENEIGLVFGKERSHSNLQGERSSTDAAILIPDWIARRWVGSLWEYSLT